MTDMTDMTDPEPQTLAERLRDEADLCRAETADDIARLLDEAAAALEASDLEATHGLDVLWHNQCVFVGRRLHRPGSEVFAEEFANHPDKQAARRRATLRAAAAITKATQP